jgi:hypothetical protein
MSWFSLADDWTVSQLCHTTNVADRDQFFLRVFVGFVFFVAKTLLVTQMLLKAVAPGFVLRVLRFLR